MASFKLVCIAVFWGVGFYLSAQNAVPIATVRAGGSLDGPSYPEQFVGLGGYVYFTTRYQGLWRGDRELSQVVKMVETPQIRVMFKRDDTIYFLAGDWPSYRLWRSDGTAEGTGLVSDRFSVAYSTNRVQDSPFAETDSGAYFLEGDGTRVWRTDFTDGGSSLVAEIQSAHIDQAGFFEYSVPVAMNGDIYFLMRQHEVGVELWRVDPDSGEAASVQFFPVQEGREFTGIPDDERLTVVDGRLYFWLTGWASEVRFNQLWAGDGSGEGTIMLREFQREGLPLAAWNMQPGADGNLYFSAYEAGTGYEPWVTDGTSEGTRRIADLAPGETSSYPQGYGVFGGRTLFFAADGQARVNAYFINDAGEPEPFLAFHPRQFGYNPYRAAGFDLAAQSDGDFYLFGEGTTEGQTTRGLWKSDGTAAGTQLVDGGAWGTVPYQTGDAVYYSGWSALGYEPAVSIDGVTQSAVNINTGGEETISALPMPFGEGAILLGLTERNDLALWRSEGDLAAPYHTITQHGVESFSLTGLPNYAELNGKLYFLSRDELHGERLWVTDGTSEGTRIAAHLALPFEGDLIFLAAGESKLYYLVASEDQSVLWSLDGTDAAPRQIGTLPADKYIPTIGESTNADHIENITVMGDQLFFSTGEYGSFELYTAGGRVSGLQLLQDYDDESVQFGEVPALYPVGDLVYYPVRKFREYGEIMTPIYDIGLWRTDGTVEGTFQIEPFAPSLQVLGGLNGAFLFGSYVLESGRRPLKITDGTVEGTSELYPDFGSVSRWDITDSGEMVLLKAVSGLQREIWTSDGTIDGTRLRAAYSIENQFFFNGAYMGRVGDKYFYTEDEQVFVFDAAGDEIAVLAGDRLGMDASDTRSFTWNETVSPFGVFGGQAYFWGREPASGDAVLWRSDGTNEGTQPVRGQADDLLLEPRILSVPGHYLFVSSLETLYSVCRAPVPQIRAPASVPLNEDLYEAEVTDIPANATLAWWIENGEIIGDADGLTVAFRPINPNPVRLGVSVALVGGCSAETETLIQVGDVLAATRWLGHITRMGGGFETRLFFHNAADTEATMSLQPFDADGGPLFARQVLVPPGSFVSHTVEAIFNGDPVSHIGVLGPETCQVTASYRSTRGPAAAAEVGEAQASDGAFVIYQGDWNVVFDGLAVTNPGDNPVNVHYVQRDEDGGLLGETIAPITIPPKGKLLQVFGDVFENHPGAAIELRTDGPIVPVFLRGSLGDALYLWVTVPVFIP